jgi:hypothetical protein
MEQPKQGEGPVDKPPFRLLWRKSTLTAVISTRAQEDIPMYLLKPVWLVKLSRTYL